MNQPMNYEMRYQTDYIAKLRDDGQECTEVVFFKGEQIHKATFPASNLGSSKRGDYLESMVASVARQHVAVDQQTSGAFISDTRIIAYLGADGALTDFHDNSIGTYRIVST